MSDAGVNEERRLVELRSIRKAFGENVVLDGIDLSIGRGEVVVIAGPSGSGKSTMLRCINGLETVDDGEVRFDGRSVSGSGKALAQLRSEIGMVFQQFNLFAHKSVMDNVTLAPMEVKGLSSCCTRVCCRA
jgi:ABC-type polar amino acid transport system ATPase subunit